MNTEFEILMSSHLSKVTGRDHNGMLEVYVDNIHGDHFFYLREVDASDLIISLSQWLKTKALEREEDSKLGPL